jgi:hypothetical protein
VTIDEMQQANRLYEELKKTIQLVAAYKEAQSIFIGTKAGSMPGWTNDITMTQSEIGDAIVAVLERRVATTRRALQELGVE